MGANDPTVRVDIIDEETWNALLSLLNNALPSVKNTDNGKALVVVNGKWSKASLTGLLPAVTAEDNGCIPIVTDGEWDIVPIANILGNLDDNEHGPAV